MQTAKVELLAPAGSREAFLGALSAGADAVYLGMEKFGARAYAENFSEEDLITTIRQAHLFGARIYLTVNTLTKETELPELTDQVSRLWKKGLDGVIVQDLGVLRALGRACPGLLLHASTQLSVTSAEGVRFLKRLGVSRVVPARELSLEELRALKEEGQIEVEAFIHGAMCYSYSGRCLMSGFLGGRSGNRGRCAGTCRLPYRVLDETGRPAGIDAGRKECYPLSMKDMSVLSILPELMDAGIDSFKIEGRMKKPEYAAGVTAIYRKYIDRFYAWDRAGRPGTWKIDPEDLRQLKSLYIRTDLGTGYYHQRNGRSLLTIGAPGYAGADEAVLDRIRDTYLKGLPQRPVQGRAVLKIGEPASLTVTAGEISVTSRAGTCQAAQGRPVTGEDVRIRLMKTGGTPFVFTDLEVEAEEGLFIPNGALNGLRREALSELEDKIASSRLPGQGTSAPGPDETDLLPERPRTDAGEGGLWAMVSNRDQLREACLAGADAVILDGFSAPLPETYRGLAARALPSILRMEDRRLLAPYLKAPALLVRTLEELEYLLEHDYRGKILADASLYISSREAAAVLMKVCDRFLLSHELSRHEIWPLLEGEGAARAMIQVYGRIPLMHTAGCLRKTEGLCLKEGGKGRAGDFWYLEDRKKVRFPVRILCGSCMNVVYNAHPLSLHSFLKEKVPASCGVRLLSFTTESARETREILTWFRDLEAGKADPGSVPFRDYTTGHYRKGVL